MPRRYIIISLVVILGVVLAAKARYEWPFIRGCIRIALDARKSNHERVQLLYQTDHAALLTACREVITNRQVYSPDRTRLKPDNSNMFLIDPHDPRIPAVIVTLEPSYILATDSNVVIELHGAFDHYGVNAFTEDTACNRTNHFPNPFKLTPGLWYYDDGLARDPDAWKRKLKRMKPRGALKPNW